MTNQYRRLLERAREDLKAAYRQREELDVTIAKLRQTVVSLGAMCPEDDVREGLKGVVPRRGALTDAVSNTILASQIPLGAKDVRDMLEELGYKFASGSSNPLASIHSVINRLVEQKRVIPVKRIGPKGTLIGDRKFWFAMGDPPDGWGALKGAVYEKGVGWTPRKAS